MKQFSESSHVAYQRKRKIGHAYTIVIYNDLSGYFDFIAWVIEVLSYMPSVGKENA